LVYGRRYVVYKANQLTLEGAANLLEHAPEAVSCAATRLALSHPSSHWDIAAGTGNGTVAAVAITGVAITVRVRFSRVPIFCLLYRGAAAWQGTPTYRAAIVCLQPVENAATDLTVTMSTIVFASTMERVLARKLRHFVTLLVLLSTDGTLSCPSVTSYTPLLVGGGGTGLALHVFSLSNLSNKISNLRAAIAQWFQN